MKIKSPLSLSTVAIFCGLCAPLSAQTAPATETNTTAVPAAETPAVQPAPRQGRAQASQEVGAIQAPADAAKDSYTFYFNAGDAPAGATKLSPDMIYTNERGYGFEPDHAVTIVDKDKAAKSGGVVTADKQFFIDAAMPEGNYKVTVTLGNPDVATTTTVKGELLRTYLPNVATKAGEYVTKTIIVNTRTPQYAGGAVRLKAPRESMQEAWNWDKGLTLEFNGDHPSVAALKIEKVNVPTVYIVGDSTSCDQMTEPYSSWGQMFTSLFKPEVAIANHGESGESYAAALGARRFDKVWSLAKPGDYIFVQFGHNDQKANNALAAYDTNLRRVVAETKKTGAQLVIITPVNRNSVGSLDQYAAACRTIAEEEKIPLIDLTAMSATLYATYGGRQAALEALFANTGPGRYDATHHGPYGSLQIAKCVALGVQQNKLDLAKYLVDGFTFDPATPDRQEDFKIPATKRSASTNDRPAGS